MARFRPEKLARWFVLGPVVIVVAVLSVANRAPTIVRFDPLPLEIETPLYLLVLFSVLVGMLIGSGVTWLSRAAWRRRARAGERRIRDLERNVEVLEAARPASGELEERPRTAKVPAAE